MLIFRGVWLIEINQVEHGPIEHMLGDFSFWESNEKWLEGKGTPFLQKKNESWKHGSKRDKRRFVYKQVGNISTEQIDHAWEGTMK